MDRWRAAGALLALAACFACSAAAPTASNQTALDLYEGAPEGCYYNFQHYGEGDRIMTNEPCLNCTCHNRMLMCYLRVCPFTKPIGQDCSVEKRADQCCPIVTCPDVPVDLLTSTSTSSPAEYGATGLGKLDKYGCSLHGKYFPEGSKVPPTPNKPCEHCYCIRNMTTCVMQECTLHVDGCTPIYHKDVCCPVRYSCDHPEDEMPLLDDMSTTVRPTPGFLLTTTTISPVTQMTQDCVHNDRIIADGASITTEKACEHCYCMKGDIVCVVQECGAPMENEGKNCTSLPPREGQCCPDTYICEGDDISTELSTEPATDSILNSLTTLSPPRRGGVEGSGYRNEPNEVYTETPTPDFEFEGSGEELEQSKPTHEPFAPEKEPEDVSPQLEEGEQYIPVTSKSTTFEEPETITKEIDRNVILDEGPKQETVEPEIYIPTTHTPVDIDDNILTTKDTEDDHVKPHEDVSITPISMPDSYDKTTTEAVESLNTVPDVIPEQDQDKSHEHASKTTKTPVVDEITEPYVTSGPVSEKTSEPEYVTPSSDFEDEIKKETPETSSAVPELVTERESSVSETDVSDVTSAPEEKDRSTLEPEEPETDIHDIDQHTEKSESPITGTTSIPVQSTEKLTTEPDHAQNTVADEDGVHPHIISGEIDKTTSYDLDIMVTEKVTKQDILEPLGHTTTQVPTLNESETTAEPEKAFGSTSVPTSEEMHSTAEPDKGLNTIPSEIIDETSSASTLTDKTKVSYPETTGSSVEITEVDIKSSTTSESSTSLLDNQAVTKGDQYTITTEPSFRKEDEAAMGTEKSKEESGPTTIKAEFVDEGLIPTSTHGEKSSTVSPLDEDITTMIPQYSEESDESKQPTTESVSKVSDIAEIISEITTSAEEEANASSTEKAIDSEIHEEHSRIPGEGDCLLNGVTYRNNTIVPSTNNCHTGCKCVSSIIKCDPIICSPPPDYMDNCQSIYDTPDSCCPTYVCDHPRETLPPQSDNQMSGTEPPAPPPTIECRGDQCELTEPAKQSVDVHTVEHKPEISQCGTESCDDGLNKPSAEQPGCAGGKCELPGTESQVKPCEGDACKVVSEEVQSPQPCEGEECKKIEVPITQTVPCEGDSCAKVDCGINGCDSSDTVPSPEKQPQEIVPSDCKGDEPCRRKDTPIDEHLPSKCEGKDCRTDSISDSESPMPEKPVDEDKQSHITNAEMQPETTPIAQLTTEHVPTEHSTYVTTKPEAITEKLLEVHNTPPITEAAVSTHEENTTPTHIKSEETEIPMESGTEKPVVKDEKEKEEIITMKPDDRDVEEHTSKPDSDYHTSTLTSDAVSDDHTDKTGLPVDEAPTVTIATIEVHTDKPATVEVEGTEKPSSEDEHTVISTMAIEELSTKIPDQVEEHTDKPEIIEDTYKPAEPVEEGSTKIPDVYIQEVTVIPSFVDKDTTNAYDDKEVYTSKPLLVKEEVMPDDEVPQTNKPAIVKEEEEDIKAHGYEEVQTAKTPLVDEEGTEMPYGEEVQTDKTPLIKEDGMKKPDDVDTLTERPSLTEDDVTKTTDAKETYTSKPQFIEEDGTEMPGDEETQTDKILSIEEDVSTNISDDQATSKPPLIDDNDTRISGDEEALTSKPLLVGEEAIKIPDSEIEHSDKPTRVEETSTILSDVSTIPTDKPALEEVIDSEKPSYIDENHVKEPAVSEDTDLPILVEEQSTDIPERHDYTDRTEGADQEVTTVPETEATKNPTDTEEQTDEITKKPDVVEEQYTSKPDSVEEQGTKMPEHVEPEHSDKPDLVGTEVPEIHDGIEDHTDKSTTIEEGTSMPDIVREHTDKPISVTDDSAMTSDSHHTHKPEYVKEDATRKPSLVEEQTGEPNLIEEDATKIPDISENETMKEKPVLVDEELPETGDQEEPYFKPSKPELPEGETTEYSYTIDDVTRKSTHTEKDTMTPEIEDGTGTKIPFVTTEKTTVKPIDIDDEANEKPLITEKEQEDPSSVKKDGETALEENQTQTSPKTPENLPTDDDKNVPKAPSEEGSGSEAPETYTYEPVKPESPVETYTDTTSDDLEKATKIPIYETETTASEEVTHTESFLETIDEHKPEVEPIQETATAGSLDDMSPHSYVTKSQDSDTTERTTKVPLPETTSQDTLPPLREGDQSEFVTPSHDLLNEIHSSTKIPELMVTESAETVSKQEEIYTDMPEEPSSVTISPENVPVEPQEGGQAEIPDSPITGPEIEISTTKADADITPEPHVSHSTSEYEGKVTKTPEMIDTDAKTTESSEPHDVEAEKMPLQTTESHLEIITPEKEERTTSTIAPEVTKPVKGFSEIGDVSVTSEQEIATEIYGESTERLEPASHEKTDMTPESPSSSDTKTTKRPEELYTESHDTEGHHTTETKPETGTELFKESASTTQIPDQSVISSESDSKSPDNSGLATDLPVSVVTESQERPVEDIATPYETTAKTPDSTDEKQPDATTIPTKVYVPEEQATVKPESYITGIEESDKLKLTESSYTVAQETDLKTEEPKLPDSQTTNIVPEKSTKPEEGEVQAPVSHGVQMTEQPTDVQKSSTEQATTFEELHTELSHVQMTTEASLSLVTGSRLTTVHETHTESHEGITEQSPDEATLVSEYTTKGPEKTSAQTEFSETTPYLIELEEHTHKKEDEMSTISPLEEEQQTDKSIQDISTLSPTENKVEPDVSTQTLPEDEHVFKTDELPTTAVPSIEGYTYKIPENEFSITPSVIKHTNAEAEKEHSEATEKVPVDEIETVTKQSQTTAGSSDETTSTEGSLLHQTTLFVPVDVSEKLPETSSTEPARNEEPTVVPTINDQKDVTTPKSADDFAETTIGILTEATHKSPIPDTDITAQTERESEATDRPLHPDIHVGSTLPEDESILSTTKATTIKQDEILSTDTEDKYGKPEEKPTSEVLPPSPTAEVPKPPTEMQPTDDMPTPDDDGRFPTGGTGYGEPDYVEEDQQFGPGTCRYGGKVYVSAQQIPRDDPCDFCFCFRSDIICLQQSCPPPIHGCHEEPIQGFCCPRYECPVSMATTVNVTTTTTTTTTTLPPHFPTHSYKGAAQRRGCQIKGHTYKVGEVVRSSSGPCLHCTCGGDGQMKCDPKACTPEPMLRQMIAAAVSAKRRR